MSQLYKMGEQPPKGTYYCTDCAMTITIDDKNTTLPICDKCMAISWRKLEA